jgi:hypothetical protein
MFSAALPHYHFKNRNVMRPPDQPWLLIASGAAFSLIAGTGI